jgi:hypothetical protein
MILIYSSPPLDKIQVDNQINILKDRLSPFFINEDDFLYSTESNLNLLREVILHHKVYLFFTESISMMGFSPMELSELITFMLKNQCIFRSEMDNLSFSYDDVDKVNSIVSEVYGKIT